MKTLRFTLYLKILSWFFLNLLLLVLGFYWFFRAQLGLGLESLFMGRAGEHIQLLTEDISYELRGLPPMLWTDILHEFETETGLKFYIYDPAMEQLAGDPVDLPGEVQTRMRRPEADLPRAPRGRPRIEPRRADPGDPTPEPPPRPRPTFMVRSTNPTHYWVGVRIPAISPRRPDFPPLILLIASDSLSAGGHFIDLKPWALLGLGGILVSVLFWAPLVAGMTRSVSQMSRATELIEVGRFDVELNSSRSDELGLLSQRINQMARRLNGFVTGQKRFLGDIAHELCSPIARANIALGILEQRTAPPQQPSVADVREEIEHMSNLVNDLLSFSKSGMQSPVPKLEPVNLAELLHPLLKRELPDLSLVRLDLPPGLMVLADRPLLARALGNILRNTARYAGQEGPIEIVAQQEQDSISLRISDQGPGVPAEALPRLFDPFFRPEDARSRDTGGVGLGLAIVKNGIESCRGTVTARNRDPHGLEITVILPRAAEPNPGPIS